MTFVFSWVLNEMHSILDDASTLNLPNFMSIFVHPGIEIKDFDVWELHMGG